LAATPRYSLKRYGYGAAAIAVSPERLYTAPDVFKHIKNAGIEFIFSTINIFDGYI